MSFLYLFIDQGTKRKMRENVQIAFVRIGMNNNGLLLVSIDESTTMELII